MPFKEKAGINAPSYQDPKHLFGVRRSVLSSGA
jgi:hypothetical protein